MASFSSLPNEILLKIFGYLTPPEFEINETRNFYSEDILNPPSMTFEQWWDFLSPRDDLKSLTETSKAMRGLALPLLYLNAVFVRSPSILNFLAILVQHPERGRWVKQVTWVLPHPESDRTTDEINNFLRTELFKKLPDLNVDPLLRYYQQPLLQLREELPGSPNMFPAGQLGAIALPLMAMTPNLVTLNLSGFQDWVAEFRNDLIDDPFFGFLEGRAFLEWYTDTIQALFPSDIFRLESYGPTGEIVGMTFPPPRLERIVKSCRAPMHLFEDRERLEHEEQPECDFITERLWLRPTRDTNKLTRVSRQLRNTLGIPVDNSSRLEDADFIAPSSIVRAASVEKFQGIQAYLDMCKSIDASSISLQEPEITDSINLLKKLGADREVPIASPFHLQILDDKTSNFRDWLVRLHTCVADRVPYCNRHSISVPLLELLEMGVESPGRPGVTDLMVCHPEMVWVPISETRFLTGGTMGVCIAHQFPNLQLLDLDFRIYIGNRKTIFHQFTPAAFGSLVELTITMEALWGPVTTVLHMLGGDMELRDDDNSLAARKLREQVWRMRKKAVERLAPSIKTLRILDWFADYHATVPDDHLKADQEQAHRESLVGGAAGPAANNAGSAGTAQVPPPPPENPYDPVADTPFLEYPEVCSPYPDHPEGMFAPSFGVRPPSPAPNPFRQADIVDRHVSFFTEAYIQALEHGLLKLFTEAPPFLSQPLMKAMCPKLTTLEFIYNLKTEDLLREDDPGAKRADLLWREWAEWAEPESGPILGWMELSERLKNHGIEFEVSEEFPSHEPSFPGEPEGIQGWQVPEDEEIELEDDRASDYYDPDQYFEAEEEADQTADLIDLTEGEYQEPMNDDDVVGVDEDWVDGEGELGGWEGGHGDMADYEGAADDDYERRMYEDAMYYDEQMEYDDGGECGFD